MQSYYEQAASLAAGATESFAKMTQQVLADTALVVKPSPLDEMASTSGDLSVLLESKFDRERLDGLEKLLAQLTRGRSIAEYFPHVVRSVASPVQAIRRLVFVLLIRGASSEPDLALMTVNALQKDLSDPNPLNRALSLHVLSSLEVPAIAPLIAMSIKKMTTDLSPIVRRAAATASERCFRLDSGLKETLKEILGPLLKEDPAPSVIGAAMTAFNAIFLHNSSLLSEGMELLDSAYFHIIQSLSGMDDWGRIEVLYGLTRYARTRFTDPLKLETPLHPDHRFLLDSCIPLLSSLNFGVIAGVVSLYYHAAPRSYLGHCTQALLRMYLLSSTQDSCQDALQLISKITSHIDKDLSPFASQFFLFGGDSLIIQDLKLSVLEDLESAYEQVMPELLIYIKSGDVPLMARSVKALGRIGTRKPDAYADKILKQLCRLVLHSDDQVVEESILSIRSILQCHPSSVPKILPRLIPLLASPDTVAPRALESIYWLCSLYFTEHYSVANQIPNILRLSAIAFPSHASSVKLQILSLAVKFCKLQKDDTNRAQSILGFLLEMARFDADLDVRDKARFWSALITSPVLVKYPKFITQWIKSIRGVKTSNILSESKNGGSSHQFTIGSLSFARNRKLAGYIPLPPFPESQVPSKRGKMAQDFQTRAGDSSISSAAQALRSQSSETAKPMKTVKLEDFYSESEEESSSALEESSEEEETDSDEDDEEEVRAS